MPKACALMHITILTYTVHYMYVPYYFQKALNQTGVQKMTLTLTSTAGSADKTAMTSKADEAAMMSTARTADEAAMTSKARTADETVMTSTARTADEAAITWTWLAFAAQEVDRGSRGKVCQTATAS